MSGLGLSDHRDILIKIFRKADKAPTVAFYFLSDLKTHSKLWYLIFRALVSQISKLAVHVC